MKNNERDNTTGKNHAGNDANSPMKILTASSLIGDRILNSAGEHLGKIKEVMLNLEDGKIEYFVVAFGGFAGMSRKYLAVPFEDLTVDPILRAFIFDKSKAALEKLKGFDKEHWPSTNLHTRPETKGNYGGFMGSNTGAEY